MANTKKSSQLDAVDLLIADHNKVKKLFKEYEKIKEDAEDSEKEALVAEICAELTVHTQIEEEIFYPAAREAIGEEEMLEEAEVEHASAKDLMEQLQSMKPSDELYDAKVKVLSEYIEHHVGEEEEEMFPKMKKSDVDLEALGADMLAIKESEQASLLAATNAKKSGNTFLRP